MIPTLLLALTPQSALAPDAIVKIDGVEVDAHALLVEPVPPVEAGPEPAWPENFCTELTHEGYTFDPTWDHGPLTARTSLGLRDIRVAIETDFEYFFVTARGSKAQALQYIDGMFGRINEMLEREIGVGIKVSYVGIHTAGANSDPWDATDTSTQLEQFRSAWANRIPATSDIAHFLSGRTLGGGIAYVGVVCDQSFGFGLSANLRGNWTWDNVNWQSLAGWDFYVVSHEIGHNMGTGHTHSYCPPLDKCFTNCEGSISCKIGTLMSYCLQCFGGGVRMTYHSTVQSTMQTYMMNDSCLPLSSLGPDDASVTVRSGPNARNYFNSTLPVLGTTWTTHHHAHTTGSLSVILATFIGAQDIPTPPAIDGSLLLHQPFVKPHRFRSQGGNFGLAIPNDSIFIGLTVFTQAVQIQGSRVTLHNAIDGHIGL